MQGTCDVKGIFLDVTIGHPGSTSGYLDFVASIFHANLEKTRFLDPGLFIYYENLWVSNEHVVAPYKNVSAGSKHACNFYHSQERIRFECLSGILVHMWIISRSSIPVIMSLKKVISLTCCLFRFHNYCKHKNELEYYEQTKIDSFFSSMNGSTQMEVDDRGNRLLIDITSRGEYSDYFIRKRVPLINIKIEGILQIAREKDSRMPRYFE